MGRVIGPVFRMSRVFIGLVIVFASIAVVIVVYLVWIVLPPLAFSMVFLNLIEVF